MSTYSLKTRNVISTWFNLFFLSILGFYLVYIEFFQDTKIDFDQTNLLNNPIETQMLTDINLLEFKNRLGTFSMRNQNKNWLMLSPKNIPAKAATINSIINELSQISITTIHEYEQINIKSFSLDKPIIELKLHNTNGLNYSIKFGILNRIDNTTYMTISGKNIIYQVKLFKSPLESYELSDFIDSNVFSVSADEISRFSLFSGNQAEARNILEKVQENWISKRFNRISNDNTAKTLQSIMDIKTHIIIDKTSEELDTFIKNYLDSPLYRINIKTKDGRNIQYKITTLTKAINELKAAKRQFFIMSASDRPYPFLINKKYLDRFAIRYNDLK